MDLPPTDQSDLIMKALDYAREQRLDTNNPEDVKKILEALDPQHTSEKQVESFILKLKNASIFLDIASKKK